MERLPELAVILVDHGSRRAESNDLLPRVAELLQQLAGFTIVETAHMELAEPSIATAFARCVARGAKVIVVHPYFLGPGRHVSEDIPRLTQEAAANHAGVAWVVTEPLGLHPLVARVVQERIERAIGLGNPAQSDAVQ